MPTLFYRDPDTGDFFPVVGGGNDHGGLFGLGDDDHPHYQTRAQKGVADGYASLSASTKVPIAQLPVGTTAASTVADGGHNHAAAGYRPITVSTAAPSGGADGDVWLTYV